MSLTTLRFLSRPLIRTFSTTQPIPVTLIPGDGIGPEIANSVKQIYAAAKAPIIWHEVDVTPVINPVTGKTEIPKTALDSINANKVALKGNK